MIACVAVRPRAAGHHLVDPMLGEWRSKVRVVGLYVAVVSSDRTGWREREDTGEGRGVVTWGGREDE